jgi:hypothetical protein
MLSHEAMRMAGEVFAVVPQVSPDSQGVAQLGMDDR